MSGVTTGTRLERLYQLRDRLEQEIATEVRRVALEGPARTRPPQTRRPVKCNVVDERLKALDVTSREVKQWAYEAGHLDHIPRGRVGVALVDMFVEARTRLMDLARDAS